MAFALFVKITQIVVLDVVLSGDNAVVIAMAAHKLPAYQRKKAIFWGGMIAIILRVVFTALMAFLLMVPIVRLVGGLVLVWIACKLLLDEEEKVVTPDNADKSTFAAIRMIFVADFVMSLDNMLAVAGAAGEKLWLLVFGLLVSIGIIMTCSAFIARLMNRFKWIVYLGAAILAYTAGEMMIGDREVASYFARSHRVSLNSHWEEDFMLTRKKVSRFDWAEELPADLQGVVRFHDGQLEFAGQMNEDQKKALLAGVAQADHEAIEEMYEQARHRDVPNWVPQGVKPHVELWFQRKWPVEVWKGIQGRQYHAVAWIFSALVIAFCLGFPYWKRGRSTQAKAPG
ncbi:MAG TPA: TerC family protein [Planctomycetaceae bacterium]|nr:TerC family protein [Planctomycetaceae bacterium]